jgi:hypothetical protein
MFTTAVAVIYCIVQRKTIKDLNDTIDRRGNLMNIQNEVVKGSNRGIKVIDRWYMKGKITSDMVDEYVEAIDVDDETKTKIENL